MTLANLSPGKGFSKTTRRMIWPFLSPEHGMAYSGEYFSADFTVFIIRQTNRHDFIKTTRGVIPQKMPLRHTQLH